MLLLGKVPPYFEMSLYNKILFFGSEPVTIFHDMYQGNFTFRNLEFVRIDSDAMIVSEGFQGMSTNGDFHFKKVRVSDILRLMLCKENCFYFDLDIFFFKKIDFDFLAYEPVVKRSLNNGIFRLSCENNRFLEDLRGFLRSQKETSEGQTFNVMWRLWDKYYPDFGTATVLEIPIIHNAVPQSKKGELVQDMKYYFRYGPFWHTYDKNDYSLLWKTHRNMFPHLYNDTIIAELSALLRDKA